MIIDIDKQLVLALKIRRGPRHDNIDFKLLIDRIVRIKPLSIIPVRSNVIKGKYRLDMKSNWDKYKKIYYQRNKVESVIKRIFGEYVRSRRVVAESRELAFRMIAYNAYRLSIILLIVIQILMVSTERKQFS